MAWKSVNLSAEEVKENDVEFNNTNRPEEEAHSVELSWNDVTGNFMLWENGQAIATFKTFNGLVNRAFKIIAPNDLEKVEQ